MGTHPIFESDFDCLTGSDILLKMSKKEIPIDTEAKLKVLDDIERKLISAIQNAGQVMTELAKDKVNEKSADRFTDKFLKEIDEVETELTRHINYLGQVTCNTPHRGSVYGKVREHEHLLSATGSAKLRAQKLIELTHPDRVPVPVEHKLPAPQIPH